MTETLIETGITKLLKIRHPILLAGMNFASGAKLAAAVTNAGGLGVVGGSLFSPRVLRLTLKNLKKQLNDPNGSFGVDIMIPKIGGDARKTNHDYSKGKLNEIIDIIIEYGTSLFVCAVGVPPRYVVDKLHQNNIPVMNMVGHPKHVKYALNAGVDIICAQGGEGGGHTGIIPTSLLLPKCVDLVRGSRSPLNPQNPVYVIGAGGIYDGRGLAMALSYGCQAVWIGTKFVCSNEAGVSIAYKNALLNASYDDTLRTLIYTGRPCRVVTNKYLQKWENERKDEMNKLLNNGIIPYTEDLKNKKIVPPLLTTGQVCGAINAILPAKEIVDNIMAEAIKTIKLNNSRLIVSKL